MQCAKPAVKSQLDSLDQSFKTVFFSHHSLHTNQHLMTKISGLTALKEAPTSHYVFKAMF